MADDDDTLPERYNHLKDLLDKIGKEADTEKRLIIIEQHYQKRDEINKMIWTAIKQNEENNNKNRINWTAIVQSVLASVIGGLVIYFLLKHGGA